MGEHDSRPTLSVVIPVYNAASTLDDLLDSLLPVLAGLASIFEVVLVNDASRDGSWQHIRAASAGRPSVRGINLMRNFGQHNALLCGIRDARCDVVVTMDDDLQNPPSQISLLLARLEDLNDPVDVVYGTPRKERHGFLRDLASVVTKLALQSAMGAETATKVSAFRAFRREVASAFEVYRGPFVSIDVLLTWGTTRFAAVPVVQEPRRAGVSNYTFGRLAAHALNMMTGFSVLPLQVASMLGFCFMLFGLSVLVYVVGRYLLQGTAAPGFSFLASIIVIFSGVQLFALGVIGEYLARMHFRSMDRPAYVVRERVGGVGSRLHG